MKSSVLVELDRPRHRRAERSRLGVGVLADDDVLLLQAQDPLRLEPERADPLRLAGLQQRVPDVLAVRRREVDLVAELADEADPQQQRVDAGDAALARVEVGERLAASSRSSATRAEDLAGPAARRG